MLLQQRCNSSSSGEGDDGSSLLLAVSGEEGTSSCPLQQPAPSNSMPATPSSSHGDAWWEVLSGLHQGHPTGESESAWVTQLLGDALASVSRDEQWNVSGIPELLTKALGTATSGNVASARGAAVGLLDFHLLVEKYRAVSASSGGSQGEVDHPEGVGVGYTLG
jgi:hypothetical protein